MLRWIVLLFAAGNVYGADVWLTNYNALKLRGVSLCATAPSDTQTLVYSGSTNSWCPGAASGSVAIGSITGLGANVATWLATPSAANLNAALTGVSGTCNGATVRSGDLTQCLAVSQSFSAVTAGTNTAALLCGAGCTLGVTSTGVITASAVGTLAQNLIFTDATYDIGASGATRPRDIFISRNLTVGGASAFTGDLTESGQFFGKAGSASSVSYAFGSTVNTGMFQVGANDIGFSIAGTEKFRFGSGAVFTAAGGLQFGQSVGVPFILMNSPSANVAVLSNQAGSVGVALDVNTNSVFKVRNIANNADAALTASTITISNSSFIFNGHTCTIVSTVVTCP